MTGGGPSVMSACSSCFTPLHKDQNICLTRTASIGPRKYVSSLIQPASLHSDTQAEEGARRPLSRSSARKHCAGVAGTSHAPIHTQLSDRVPKILPKAPARTHFLIVFTPTSECTSCASDYTRKSNAGARPDRRCKNAVRHRPVEVNIRAAISSSRLRMGCERLFLY